MADSVMMVNDVSATVAHLGAMWTLLGFLCGGIVAGAIIYVVSR